MPSLIEQGFSKGELGIALSAISIAYGFSKFVMGTASESNNARTFLTLGLILTAIVNLLLGFVPFFTSSITIHAYHAIPKRMVSRYGVAAFRTRLSSLV